MESTRKSFLSWVEIHSKVKKGDELNPIDKFLYYKSPPIDENEFRTSVFEAVGYESEEERTERNTSVVSDFMDHCKENGIDIPYSVFESYFRAK